MPSLLRGVLATLLLVLNTLFWCSLVFLGALVKLLLPFEPVRRRIDPLLNLFANGWVACNSGWMRLTQPTRWDVQGAEGLDAAAGTW